MTLQGVGPVCFGSVAAGIGTGGAIALAGGAAALTAGWILTWHPPTSPVPVRSLQERLQGARSNLRFTDKRVADLEVELLELKAASRR
jgi:hypothetical protein